ncbi:MAG: hypothetical protein KAU36_06255, partial [candidate division Zixibacteria bacterium]|nr:hypothetical protein [candidate division Zixibacteria bacterium]
MPLLSNQVRASGSVDQTELTDALVRLKPGRLVRVFSEDRGTTEGLFSTSTRDTLYLTVDQSTIAYPTSAIDTLWALGRAVRKGATIGGIIGGLGGMALAGLWKSAGSGTDSEVGAGAFPLLGLAGAIAGGLVGTVVGSTQLKWHLKYKRTATASPDDTTVTVAPTDRRSTRTDSPENPRGSIAVFAEYSKRSTDFYGGSFGGHINFLTFVHRNIAIGPEIGIARVKIDEPLSWSESKDLYYVAAVAKIAKNIALSPYLIGGVGTNITVDDLAVEYNFGGGFDSEVSPHISIMTEVRRHDIIAAGEPGFSNIKAG